MQDVLLRLFFAVFWRFCASCVGTVVCVRAVVLVLCEGLGEELLVLGERLRREAAQLSTDAIQETAAARRGIGRGSLYCVRNGRDWS